MRYWSRIIAALAVAGCSSSAAPSADRITGQTTALFSIEASEEAPPIVFNTQMRSDIEVPACASESQGHAQIKILQDGTIESTVILNNKGDESVRFGHIHHLTPGAATGPVIWWLSSPVGVDLNLTDRHIDIRQAGIFVPNPHFTSTEAGLAELLAHPGDFYVNFHSDRCPGGVARGFLP
jgi:CHRD domain